MSNNKFLTRLLTLVERNGRYSAGVEQKYVRAALFTAATRCVETEC